MDVTDEKWLPLLEKLRAKGGTLIHQGWFSSEIECGRRVWVLRFRENECGRCRLKSIRIGGDPLKARAEAWLADLRRIVTWQREIETGERILAWLSRRLAPRTFLFNWGKKRKRRQVAS
jgi:hypothetical protein